MASSSPITFFAYAMPVIASFLVAPDTRGVEVISDVIAFSMILLSITIAGRLAKAFELSEMFFYLSIPTSFRRFYSLYLGASLIVLAPMPFLILGNQEIVPVYGLFYLLALYTVTYTSAGFAVSVLAKSRQAVSMIEFAMASVPLIAAFFAIGPHQKELLPLLAISPFTGIMAFESGFHSIYALWLPLLCAVILALLAVSFLLSRRYIL